MKKSLLYLSILLIGSTLTSCVSTNKGFQSSPVVARNVQLDPIKADIEVNEKEKLKGTSTSTYFLIFRVQGDNMFADGINYSTDASMPVFAKYNPYTMMKIARLNGIRSAAAYKALEGKDYDLLVHPNYSVKLENYLLVKKYTIDVTGYGAKYKNFRTERQKVVILDSGKEITFPDTK